jgi:hypothetical protein
MKKFKDIKTNPEPAKGKNVDPDQLGQYSAKYQVSEGSASLNQYLSSRGINPKFVSTATKIAHSKSSQFIKWQQDHMRNLKKEETLDEVSMDNISPMMQAHVKKGRVGSLNVGTRMASPKPTLKPKVKPKKVGLFQRLFAGEEVQMEETNKKDIVCFDIPLLIRVLEFTREEMSTDIELHNMVERLINMRDNVPLDMSHYDEITQKLVKENHIAIAMGKMLDDEGSMVLSQLEQLERAIAMVRSYIGKDYEKQLPAWVQAKITLATDYVDTVGNYIVSKDEKVNESVKKPNPSALDKFRKASDEREKKHAETEKNSGGMTSAIDRLQKHMNKEEAELDEMITEVLSKDASAGDWIHDFVHSKNPKFAGKSTAERKKMALGAYYGKKNEDMWQDPQAATQTPADGANGGNQVADRKRQMSKSARIIKSLYKKKGVVKEDMYDHEKEDKSVATYGKKPKMSQTDKKDSLGENKPQAAATLSGGTTLTGVKRDSIEIDPIMRNRPGNRPDQPDISKKSGQK